MLLYRVLLCGWLIATVVCSCSLQFRRDYYLSEWTYPEPWAQIPTTGGRLQLVLKTEPGVLPTLPLQVEIGGYRIVIDESTDINTVTSGNVQWIHFEAGADRGVLSLHAPKDTWLPTISTVVVKNAHGQSLARSGACSVTLDAPATIAATYVTSRNQWQELVVHLHNLDTSSSHNVTGLVVNGASQPTSVVPASLQMGPNTHQVIVVPLHQQLSEGAVWTVEVQVDSAAWFGNGGRLGKEVFFVEGWPKSQQCPFPVANGGDVPSFLAFRDVLGMNAFFGFASGCNNQESEVLANATRNGYFIMLPSGNDKMNIPDTSVLMALSSGDEVDNKITDTASQWKKVLKVRKSHPDVSVYQGGKTNHWDGAFAGISDVQGIDFYIAACAPHITPSLTPMSITGSHDYLRNTRNNHMPLPAWGYSQALCTDCWNTVINSGEFTLQIASAITAGVKTLLLFMADSRAIGLQAFKDGGSVIRSFNAVRETIRTGDIIQGAAASTVSPSSASVMLETIAGPNNTFLVIIANTQASGYNDLLCEVYVDNHWTFTQQTVDSVQLGVTPSAQMAEPTHAVVVQEAVDGSLGPLQQGATLAYDAAQRQIEISNVILGTEVVVRIFFVKLQ